MSRRRQTNTVAARPWNKKDLITPAWKYIQIKMTLIQGWNPASAAGWGHVRGRRVCVWIACVCACVRAFALAVMDGWRHLNCQLETTPLWFLCGVPTTYAGNVTDYFEKSYFHFTFYKPMTHRHCHRTGWEMGNKLDIQKNNINNKKETKMHGNQWIWWEKLKDGTRLGRRSSCREIKSAHGRCHVGGGGGGGAASH